LSVMRAAPLRRPAKGEWGLRAGVRGNAVGVAAWKRNRRGYSHRHHQGADKGSVQNAVLPEGQALIE
jgi:hypothetical protein